MILSLLIDREDGHVHAIDLELLVRFRAPHGLRAYKSGEPRAIEFRGSVQTDRSPVYLCKNRERMLRGRDGLVLRIAGGLNPYDSAHPKEVHRNVLGSDPDTGHLITILSCVSVAP